MFPISRVLLDQLLLGRLWNPEGGRTVENRWRKGKGLTYLRCVVDFDQDLIIVQARDRVIGFDRASHIVLINQLQ